MPFKNDKDIQTLNLLCLIVKKTLSGCSRARDQIGKSKKLVPFNYRNNYYLLSEQFFWCTVGTQLWNGCPQARDQSGKFKKLVLFTTENYHNFVNV